ncbi:MAG TPA: acetoacetate decarboxylase family protein, partial [Candidatus Limnocylindrales bacterium]|nr:acetoacetate decarboxylase family protein [Candidatus Limnocylindrales bacterium]
MKRLVAGSVVATAIGASVAQAVARGRQERAAAAFYRPTGTPQRVVVDGREFWLPMIIHRMDGFGSLHPASMAAARELLPSDALEPVRLPDGRAAVMVTAFRYYELTDSGPARTESAEPPYAEVAVTILATVGGRAPLLSLALMGAQLTPMAGYVPHMAVTHRLARDGGRDVWGVPKFVADVDFVDDVTLREVRLAEGERHILTLTVRPTGRLRLSTQPSVMYTVLDGRLIETRMPSVIQS